MIYEAFERRSDLRIANLGRTVTHFLFTSQSQFRMLGWRVFANPSQSQTKLKFDVSNNHGGLFIYYLTGVMKHNAKIGLKADLPQNPLSIFLIFMIVYLWNFIQFSCNTYQIDRLLFYFHNVLAITRSFSIDQSSFFVIAINSIFQMGLLFVGARHLSIMKSEVIEISARFSMKVLDL